MLCHEQMTLSKHSPVFKVLKELILQYIDCMCPEMISIVLIVLFHDMLQSRSTSNKVICIHYLLQLRVTQYSVVLNPLHHYSL